MLRSVHLSVYPFSHSVTFARWGYARVAVSNAFDRWQHGCYARVQKLSVGGGHIASRGLVVLQRRSGKECERGCSCDSVASGRHLPGQVTKCTAEYHSQQLQLNGSVH